MVNIIDTVCAKADEASIRQAGQILKRGGLVAFPTETVYGLGADALNEDAAAKIYAAKGRPSDNPLIVHITERKMLDAIVSEVSTQAELLMEKFWPGPMTLIFKKSALVPYGTTGGLDTVAVRMPSHPVARAVIDAGGGYIAAPSANVSGRPSTTTAAHVIEDLSGRIEMILDGGQAVIGLESTIVDMSVEPPVILRPGAITKDMMEAVIGPVEIDKAIIAPNSGVKPKAPGMKYRHYAPRADLTIVEGPSDKVVETMNRMAAEAEAEGKKVGIIATDETASRYPHGLVMSLGARSREEEIAMHLFEVLRKFDDTDVNCIFSESFEDAAIGAAIMNRLLKAAGHKVVRV